ncbi:Uncharacterised protein [Yersinia enterocolitica]|nr:Uncharacterised protein [Yersinia enterocolitica]
MALFQPRLLAIDLFNQCPTHSTNANDKHFYHLIGVKQHLVADTDTGCHGIIAHDHRNGALRRALSDRNDIDVGASER